jgi:hypothetical protein
MLPLRPQPVGINAAIEIAQTKEFAVYNLADAGSVRSVDSYKIEGFRNCKDARFLKNMHRHGLTTWRDLVPEENRLKALKSVKRFATTLIQSYDATDDEFQGIDQEEMNITRMPRIGRGKHNIHFDPQFSEQHRILEELTHAAHFSDILTHYMGTKCTLRESGVTITRPYDSNMHNLPVRSAPVVERYKGTKSAPTAEADEPAAIQPGQENDTDIAAGEGMEWHSDGSKGECTILMALEDVSPEQGSLRVVPGSHRIYVDGVGHTEVSAVHRTNYTRTERSSSFLPTSAFE